VRIIHETLQTFRRPVIAPRDPACVIHALLHDDPLTVIGQDEAVEIEIESILHGGAVDLGDETAGPHESIAVEPQLLSDSEKLLRGGAGVPPAAAADMNTKLSLKRGQAALQGADHAGGDAGGMPVHPHDRAEGLKPERIGEPAQQLRTPVMMHDRFSHDGAEPGHALREPLRHAPAMERQVCGSGATRHFQPQSGFCLERIRNSTKGKAHWGRNPARRDGKRRGNAAPRAPGCCAPI